MTEENVDAKIDEIFSKVDALCRAGKFSDLDTLITELDISELCSTLIVGWLVITKSARDHLPGRPDFVDRCETKLQKLCPTRVEKLLKGHK